MEVEIYELSYPINGSNEPAFSPAPCCLAIGHFDGVHLGHRHVIDRAVEEARRSGTRAAVMTFHPHPREVLGIGSGFAECLTPLDAKLELFREAGADAVFIMQFDPAFAAISPEMFAREVLVPLGVSHAVVGFDFTFGSRGAGTPHMLAELGSGSFTVDIVPAAQRDGLKVSSTYVREALEDGRVDLAAELLGRPYRVSGIVVHGDARGRLLGFPTANLSPDQPYVLPRLGVYAVKVRIPSPLGGEPAVHDAVLNHGMKPTFNKDKIVPVLEAHLLDFEGDLYGNRLEIDFVHFLRTEQKFSGIDELVSQLGRDKARARELLED
ncbi:bifunctional riboflavin kinase/FAD synthetase [Paenibacillus humicus]|uniref:bifunctional riboflavin kinase/FAD synthetase n=1 Tax=Paenibacillus humicus TaxID=412861 RepID=UPI000FD82CDC|nr:bifunctional riboflavin kinase/FAD synthetase [Paenibacillus humicus]